MINIIRPSQEVSIKEIIIAIHKDIKIIHIPNIKGEEAKNKVDEKANIKDIKNDKNIYNTRELV